MDPALGTLKDFEKLVKEANKAGIRIILDGVFNHMSSDSSFFDRYRVYDTVGAVGGRTGPRLPPPPPRAAAGWDGSELGGSFLLPRRRGPARAAGQLVLSSRPRPRHGRLAR